MADQLVNLKDPDTGEIGSLPASQVPAALQQGFTQAAPEEVDSFFKEQKYGGLKQQLATAAEGAGSALTFGATTGIERALGVPAEDIRARREVNPVSHMAGELGGIGLGMLTGSGEAAVLDRVGAGIAGSIAGESALSKIGSTAARLAAENAMFSGGDEVSKMFSSDPNQTVGTAMADVGLSALLGAGTGVAFGGASQLWKATAGKQIESALNALKTKAGGIEGIVSDPVREAIDKSGVELAPEVRAALSDDPHLQNMAKTLEQSDTTKPGVEYQQTLNAAKQDLSNSVLSTLGHDANTVEGLGELSKYEAGKKVGNALADEIQARVEPLAKEFEELKGKVGNVELPADGFVEAPVTKQGLLGEPVTTVEKVRAPGVLSQAADKIGDLALKEGWTVADGTPVNDLFQFVQKNLGKQKTLKDLGNFISRVGEKGESLSSLTDRSATRAAAMMKGILKDVEAGVIESKLGERGAELVERFRGVRDAWRKASDLVDEVQEQIGVRASTSGYAKAIREMAQQDGEALLRRIAGNGNAAGLKLLQEQFPKAAEAFKQFHLDSIVKAGASKAGPGQVINPKAIMRAIEGLSPEMRSFVIPEIAQQKIGAVGTILEQLEKAPHNFSNTARTLDKLNKYIPGGAVALASAASGHPLLGMVAGSLMKYLSKDVPDAVRLSMLKFLGSSQAVDSAGFKAMVDMARSAYRGESLMSKAAKGVLKGGSNILGKQDVSQNDVKKLDKQLLAIKEDPTKLMGVGGDMGHYLPDHATAAATVAAQAANYLNSLRPNTDKQMPLDAKLPPDPVKEAQFTRALEIAENPLIVMKDVKEGSITPADLTTLHNVAPGFYSAMRDKLNAEIINHTAEGESIPYQTRLGLALFLGQPLDSTMTPMGIQGAQPMMAQAPQPQVKPTATGMQKLSKLPASYADASQARQMGRAKHLA